jgi:hypothetical protein
MATTAPEPGDDRIQQLSVLVENRTVALGAVTRALTEFHVRILAISILAAGEHAVVRLVVDAPAQATLALQGLGYTVMRSNLLGVALPLAAEPEVGIRKVLAALVSAEVRVEYVYALIAPVDGHPVIAVHVDDLPVAARAIRSVGLTLMDQARLGWGGLPEA